MSQKGFVVQAEKVTGNKEMRAYPFSTAVNSGRVFLVLKSDGSQPPWQKKYKSELRYFPASTYKDQVDASADAYSHLMRLFYRGPVAKNVSETNLLHRSLFRTRFGEKIPPHWEVAAAVRIAHDSSRPSGYCITARAAENAYLGEAVFIVAAARMYVDNPIRVLDALRLDLIKHCAKGVTHPDVIWLNKGAGDVLQVTAQKMDMWLAEFTDEATAGIPEMNYYFQEIPGLSPFYGREGTTRCHVLVDDDQFETGEVRDEGGMLSLRQDWKTWSYTDKGEVQPFGGITLDCVRMTIFKFALTATALSPDERRLAKLPSELQPAAVRAKLHTPEFVELVFAQENALRQMRMKEEEEEEQGFVGEYLGKRPFLHRYTRPR
jgi:hypothetical protein